MLAGHHATGISARFINGLCDRGHHADGDSVAEGNRIFALSAYNAGPSAVKRWRRKSNRKLDAAAWVEVIPYKETRDYVQAVLAYRSVYAYKLGQPTELMSDLERKGKY